MILHYRIHEVSKYINWEYFFHAWGVRGENNEAKQLQEDADRMLSILDGDFRTHAVFRLMEANSEGNDIWLENTRFPCLRQQTAKEGSSYLCISDFIRPLSSGIPDKVGIFATTVDSDMESNYSDDNYRSLLMKTLADRLAEATAERLHEQVRKDFWGYAPHENLSIHQLHKEVFQGTRPAVGYPSLPDLSVNFLLNQLLDMEQIGIHLTENGMMQPHASVSGLMIAHPASHYFSVGPINEEQVKDYATRRGISIEVIRKFLGVNLQ